MRCGRKTFVPDVQEFATEEAGRLLWLSSWRTKHGGSLLILGRGPATPLLQRRSDGAAPQSKCNQFHFLFCGISPFRHISSLSLPGGLKSYPIGPCLLLRFCSAHCPTRPTRPPSTLRVPLP